MYRLTIHQRDENSVDEIEDEDELRDAIETALDDLEHKRIKTFCVSWLSKKRWRKPFWEESPRKG